MRASTRTLLVLGILASLRPATLAAQTAAWTIASEPEVVIGASANDPDDQLGRVVDVARFADGTIAILDGLLHTVRLYDGAGRHVRDVGREGDGPGEFADPTDLAVVGDTLLVIDADGRRTWFDRTGRVLRTDRVVTASWCSEDYHASQGGLFPDGTLLVRCEERLFGRVKGEYRAHVVLLRESSSGDVPIRLGRFASDSGRTDADGVAVPRPYVPSTELLTATTAGRVFAVVPDRAEIRVVPASGASAGFAVVVPAPRRAVTDGDVEDAADAMLRYVVRPNDRRVVGEWVSGMPRSERTPVFRGLLAAGPEEAWVETWEPAEGGRWWVVADVSTAAGGAVARLRAPPALELRTIGRDDVLGLWRDEFGVEQVRVYALTRR